MTRYPAFIAEMALPANRPKLQFGVWSGFAIVGGFALLAAAAAVTDVTPWRWAYVALVATKLLTNAIAWLALIRDRWVLETQGLNTFADIALMTAVIYFTGAAQSPLIPIYVIEITVLALLSNLGVSILMASLMLLLYATMLALVATGVLPPTPVPGDRGPGLVPTAGQVGVTVLYAALVIGIPTFFATATLRLLRVKERALEARTAELVEASVQRAQFMASVTHELRTPIHQVQGLADVIATGVYGPVADKQRDALGSIKRSAHQLLSLVDDLLTLARAESDRLAPRVSEVAIAPLVSQVVASSSWMLGTKPMTVRARVADELPAVATDPRLLAHVLVNLIANAIKFTPDGGTVEVRATRDGDAIALAVVDDGVGIPADRLETIFEPFVQLDGGDERRFGGVGLGLALVRRLCDGLGAEVTVESDPGRGSTFTVRVPIAWTRPIPSDPAATADVQARN